jgi:hypothetical protein
MKSTKELLIVALALTSTPAFGQAITGNSLHEACQSFDDGQGKASERPFGDGRFATA